MFEERVNSTFFVKKSVRCRVYFKRLDTSGHTNSTQNGCQQRSESRLASVNKGLNRGWPPVSEKVTLCRLFENDDGLVA